MGNLGLDDRTVARRTARPVHRPAASRPLGDLSAAPLFALQRTAGNRAVSRLIARQGHLVQRCGPGSDCDCPQSERDSAMRAAASGHAVQRAVGDGHDLKSPRFAGEERLEACFDDEARLTIGATGPAVAKVQQALIDLNHDLGPMGADGIYGQRTWNAVKRFKAEERLGFEHMGDVGPGTMRRLDELFPGDGPTPPEPPKPPDLPFAVVEPLVCGGAEAEGAETTGGDDGGAFGDLLGDAGDLFSGAGDLLGGAGGLLGGAGGLLGGAAGLLEGVQRQEAAPPAAPQPGCSVPADFSAFKGKPPAGTTLSAFAAAKLDLSGGVVVAQFVGGASWVNPNRVPVGGKRVSVDAQVVAACDAAFQKPNTANFTASPSGACPAFTATTQPKTATSATECETVIGVGLDKARQNDANTRLLTHEQYHVHLACSVARLANKLIAGGTNPKAALGRARKAFGALLRKYDAESDHGCNAAGQAKWQADIDADKLTI